MAQINNINTNLPGQSYGNYASFQTAKDLVTAVKGKIQWFPECSTRELVATGFSLGGIKAIYSHYNKADDVTKAVLFNPCVGEWTTQVSTDPQDYRNPWHDERLTE